MMIATMQQVFLSTSKKLFCHDRRPKKMKKLKRHGDGIMKKRRRSRNGATSYVLLLFGGRRLNDYYILSTRLINEINGSKFLSCS